MSDWLVTSGGSDPIFWVVKTLARLWFPVPTALRRRAQFHRWVLAGSCNQCAVCCERPSIMVDRITWDVAPVRRMFLWWQRTVNGFDLVSANPPNVFVFRCRHFDARSRVCTSYASRPGLCRDYPRVLLEQHNPEFYKECSYRAVASNASRLLRIVNRAPLTDEQKAEMKRRLRLE